jgi:hypothetical protein
VSVPVESLGAETYCAGPAASGCPNGTITGAGYSIEVDVLLTPYLDTGFGIARTSSGASTSRTTHGAALSLSFIFAQDIDAIEAAGLVNTVVRLGPRTPTAMRPAR